jgi:hypothetical protein
MTSAAWHPIGIVVDTSDSDWRLRLAAMSLGAPVESWRSVVSFCDPAVGFVLPGGWQAAVHWSDLVPPVLHDQFWRTSYSQVRALLGTLTLNGQTVLQCYLHVLADALTRNRVWDYLAQTARPAVVLMPPNSELQNRTPRLHHARSWVAGFVGGQANLDRVRGWFSELRKPSAGPTVGEPRCEAGILMLVEDGVSGVHRLPALAVAAELQRRGLPFRMLTSNAAMARAFSEAGHPAGTVRPRSILRFAGGALLRAVPAWLGLVLQMRRQSTLTNEMSQGFVAWFRYAALGFVLRRMLLEDAIRQAAAAARVQMVLALGETFPLVFVGLDWARAHGIPDAAVTPVLIGGRPDNEDFPASAHLVYGDQAAEWMRGMGVPADAVRVVGSPTYEVALGRDRSLDIDRARVMVPGWVPPQRLVVVATEALPRPEAELVPVLRACLALGDIHAVVKLHPADSAVAIAAIIREHVGSDSRISLLAACDLTALLHAADLLVCVQSNIAITAAMMGTPTMLPTYVGRYRPVDLAVDGFATECASENEVPALIHGMTRGGPVRQSAIAGMRHGIRRFAGKADGRSHVYIADVVTELISQRRQPQT